MSNAQRLVDKHSTRRQRLQIDGSCIMAEVERLLSVVEELEAVLSANLQRACRLREFIVEAFSVEL